MLILDKQRAMARIVALTESRAVAALAGQPRRWTPRSGASYQPRPEAETVTSGRARSRRRGRWGAGAPFPT